MKKLNTHNKEASYLQLNETTCYAMQIMLYLARTPRIVSSTELAEHLNISQRYVLKISKDLREGGLVVSYAGMNGGLTMTKKPEDISVFDIVETLEGDMRVPSCASRYPDCKKPCADSNLFDSLSAMKDIIKAYLKTITFDKLAKMETDGLYSEILDIVEAGIAKDKE